jgi:hypothetical protein
MLLRGAVMKRTALALITIFVILFVGSRAQEVMASDELYLWKLQYPGAQVTAEYQIHITAPDSWQANTPYNVYVNLISKNYYKVQIDSAKVILESEAFSLESFSQEEPKMLTEPADIYAEKFSFNLPTDKLVTGEKFTVSATAVISLSSVAGSSEGLNGTWNNYDDPVTAKLYFSSQSTSSLEPTPTPPEGDPYSNPAIFAIGPVIAIVVGAVFLLVYFKKRKQ